MTSIAKCVALLFLSFFPVANSSSNKVNDCGEWVKARRMTSDGGVVRRSSTADSRSSRVITPVTTPAPVPVAIAGSGSDCASGSGPRIMDPHSLPSSSAPVSLPRLCPTASLEASVSAPSFCPLALAMDTIPTVAPNDTAQVCYTLLRYLLPN